MGNKKEEGLKVDLLPEEVDWRDEGCGLFPSCLNCQLPKCIEEEPRGKQRLRMSARARKMLQLRRDGKSVKEIARVFGVSQRTVQRALDLTESHRRSTRRMKVKSEKLKTKNFTF